MVVNGVEAQWKRQKLPMALQAQEMKPGLSSKEAPDSQKASNQAHLRPKRTKENGKNPHQQPCRPVKTLNQRDVKKKPSIDPVPQSSSLKEEITQLENRLKDQLAERRALEGALGCGSSSSPAKGGGDGWKPDPARELIREIAVLELEVAHMEKYLLSLYRRAFELQMPASSPAGIGDDSMKNPSSHKGEQKKPHEIKRRKPLLPPEETGPGVCRSHSALSYREVRMSFQLENLARVLDSIDSRRLSSAEDDRIDNSGVVSLAEHLGTNVVDLARESLNSISEEMVRCMGAVYSKLVVDPPVHPGGVWSPASSFSSSISLSSPQHFDIWSPRRRAESKLDSRLINPFEVEGLKEFSGPYSSMVEVSSICMERRRLSDVENILQTFKSLVYRLETLDPRRMKEEEKLAFWINIHNALIMNTYLEHGIPQNDMKMQSLLLKAMCVVNGRLISAATIQSSILRCHSHSFGQWVRTVLSPKARSFRHKDEWQAYAIKHPEPLLHFALSSGNHSDPAVRVYTPKKVYEQLKSAQEEYIRATVGVWNEEKILLPKLIDNFARDKGLSSQGVVDMIKKYLPETMRIAMQRCVRRQKPGKVVEWVPHSMCFRYLLSRELLASH